MTPEYDLRNEVRLLKERVDHLEKALHGLHNRTAHIQKVRETTKKDWNKIIGE